MAFIGALLIGLYLLLVTLNDKGKWARVNREYEEDIKSHNYNLPLQSQLWLDIMSSQCDFDNKYFPDRASQYKENGDNHMGYITERYRDRAVAVKEKIESMGYDFYSKAYYLKDYINYPYRYGKKYVSSMDEILGREIRE